MAKIAICDDEELIRNQLYNITKEYLEKRNIKASIMTFSSGLNLLKILENEDISCLFMDIDLHEDTNGIEIVRMLRKYKKTTLIIFVTSYTEYAHKVLSLHTFDYITKPYKNKEICRVLDDVFLWLKNNDKISQHKVQFKTINGIVSLNVEEIIFFEYKNRRIDIITKDTTYHMYGKIRDIYKEVENYHFAVPHISYVVNLNEIKAIIKSELKIIMTNDCDIPISQLKLKEFRNTYFEYVKKLGEDK